VPTVYLERLQSVITDNDNRLMYHSMVLVLDDVVGNVTRSMKEAQLWDSTIFVLSSDNVPPNPPLYQAQKTTVMRRKATQRHLSARAWSHLRVICVCREGRPTTLPTLRTIFH
jgi:hypothetical protein